MPIQNKNIKFHYNISSQLNYFKGQINRLDYINFIIEIVYSFAYH